jgi:hypothetical protein
MLDTALQIHYDAFEDCERVVIDYQGMRSAIGFETDEELCIYLVGCGYPEYVNTEVCSEVRRHRMADQMEFEEARCRALEEYVPRRCTDAARTRPAGFFYREFCGGYQLGFVVSLALVAIGLVVRIVLDAWGYWS